MRLPGQRPFTICHPVWRLGSGGLERQLLQLLRFLPPEGFRHVLVVRGDAAQVPLQRNLPDNVRLVRHSARAKDRLYGLKLASVVREYWVDVLHVRGFSMLLDSLLAARLCGDTAVAFSFHGFETAGTGFGVLRRSLYRAAVGRCEDRWAVSRSAADAVAAELGLPAEQFGVIVNGVDSDRYVPASNVSAVRQRLNLPPDRLVVLSVGNLKSVKGHDVLLQAVARLGDSGKQTVLVLVGGDYLHGSLQALAAKRLPECDIRFVGEQPDVLPWYQSADLFVLPSRWEGLSNALLEAMSCGLPVIATAVGGNLDVLEDGRTGLLVQPDDPDRLASAIARLLIEPAERTRLATAGRQQVRRHFAIAATAAAYARRYESIARWVRARRRPGVSVSQPTLQDTIGGRAR